MIGKPINGFLSVLGSAPLQFSMLLTLLAMAWFDKIQEYSMLYHQLWVMHLLSFLVICLNNLLTPDTCVAKLAFNTFTMLF